MKKILPVLFFLLFLLIISCVYQKTSEIYSQKNTEESNTTKTVSKPQLLSKINVKVVPKDKTEILASQEQEIETSKAEETKKPQEATLLEKIKSKITATIPSRYTTTKTEILDTITSNEGKAVNTHPEIIKKTLDNEEEEVVEYLLQVLKERDLAIEERNKVETQLQQVIDKALEERRIAIEHMYSEVEKLQAKQQKLLNERDLTAKQLEEQTTKEKGK